MLRVSMHRYRLYLFAQGLTVLVVLFLFRGVADRGVAGLVAGLIFFLVASGIWLYELRFGRGARSLSFWACTLFVAVSALPILFLRLAYWGMPFELLSVGGITGPQLHKVSNYVFAGMLVAHFVDGMLLARQKTP